MKLKGTDYTKSELALLAALPVKKTAALTTSELARKHYGRRAPKFARQSTSTLLRRLTAKLAKSNEVMIVRSTGNHGPHETGYWLGRNSYK